jgi:hypothetical protein
MNKKCSKLPRGSFHLDNSQQQKEKAEASSSTTGILFFLHRAIKPS